MEINKGLRTTKENNIGREYTFQSITLMKKYFDVYVSQTSKYWKLLRCRVKSLFIRTGISFWEKVFIPTISYFVCKCHICDKIWLKYRMTQDCIKIIIFKWSSPSHLSVSSSSNDNDRLNRNIVSVFCMCSVGLLLGVKW